MLTSRKYYLEREIKEHAWVEITAEQAEVLGEGDWEAAAFQLATDTGLWKTDETKRTAEHVGETDGSG